MTFRFGRRAHPWLLLLAATAAALLAAELIIISSGDQSWRGRPSAYAGWGFELVVATLLAVITRAEAVNRRRTSRLVAGLDESLASITALTEASLASLRLDELLEQLLERLRDVLGASAAVVLLAETAGDALVARAAVGLSNAASLRIPVEDPVIAAVLWDREARTVSDPVSLASLADPAAVHLASAALCPIHIEDRVMGVCVVFRSTSAALEPHQLHLLQVVADRAGSAIERARLDDAERQSRMQLERARRHVSMLADASVALSTARDSYEQILESLFDIVVPSFGDFCAIDALSVGGARGATLMRGSFAQGGAGRDRLRQSQSEMVEMVLAGSGPDALTETFDRFEPADRQSSDQSGIQLIVAAIPVNDLPFGAITFAVDPYRHPYDDADVETARDLARRIGVTIERVLLYRDARESAERSRRIAAQLEQLIDTSLDLPQARTAAEVLADVADRARVVVDAQFCIVAADVGAQQRLFATAGVDAGRILEQVTRPPESSDEAAIDLDSVAAGDDWARASIYGSAGEIRGTIAVRKGGRPIPVTDDEAVLALLAQMASSALDSVALYQAIQSSEARWRALVESAPIGIVEVDLDGQVRRWNRAAATLFSWPGVGPTARPPLFPSGVIDELRSLWSDVVRGSPVAGRELRAVELAPSKRDLAISGAPLIGSDGEVSGILTLVADETDRIRLEEDLRHAQRMEAVGQLAGSVAHEFNNLLTLINGYAELLLGQLADDAPAVDLVEEVTKVTDRAAMLTSQLLTISRRQPPEPSVLNPIEAVDSILNVLARVMGSNIQVQCDFDPTTGAIEIDPAGFQQVVVNLAINARDAMPDGGFLTIEIGNADLAVGNPAALAPGRYVRIAIADTGIGMDEATLERCFEPFFTTKPPSRGTGLGLPAVRNVVVEGGGAIRAASLLGKGSSFAVLLPVASKVPPRLLAQPSKERAAVCPAVLVADDDEAVCNLVDRVLSHNRFDVVTASTAERALDIAHRATEAFDLLVSDIAMPGMSGVDLAQVLRAECPNLPVLFISGNPLDLSDGGIAVDSVSFLAKPFTPRELLSAVEDLLTSTADTRI